MKPRWLKSVPPPQLDERTWRQLMNHLYGSEEDRLFEWLRSVCQVVEEAEREKERAA